MKQRRYDMVLGTNSSLSCLHCLEYDGRTQHDGGSSKHAGVRVSRAASSIVTRTVALIICFTCVGLVNATKQTGFLGMTGPANSLDRVEDWQISASSARVHDSRCQEKYARLYLPDNFSWCPQEKSDSEWLQLDLGSISQVNGVLTQGRTGSGEFISAFRVSYSRDALHWQYITDQFNDPKLFPGNTDDHSLRYNYFEDPILTRFLKIHTARWTLHPSLRVEIIGMQECKQPLGLPPFGRISSIIDDDPRCHPDEAFLIGHSGWCTTKDHNDMWLQADIGYPSSISAVVTKGKGDSEDYWVTKYLLSYSNDSEHWVFVRTKPGGKPKVFDGNMDKDSERVHFLNEPFISRYVRFYPVEWHNRPGLRIGIFGCSHTGECDKGYFRVNDGSSCVENVAFGKKKWAILRQRKAAGSRNKRTVRRKTKGKRFPWILSKNAEIDNCFRQTVAANSNKQLWIVDFGNVKRISGAILNETSVIGDHKNLENIHEKLSIYIDVALAEFHLAQRLCNVHVMKSGHNGGRLPSNHEFQLHIQCVSPLWGRYMFIQREGSSMNKTKLCDIRVYE